jgi:hypothetical protein
VKRVKLAFAQTVDSSPSNLINAARTLGTWTKARAEAASGELGVE